MVARYDSGALSGDLMVCKAGDDEYVPFEKALVKMRKSLSRSKGKKKGFKSLARKALCGGGVTSSHPSLIYLFSFFLEPCPLGLPVTT